MKYLHTNTRDKEIEYKSRRTTAKTEIRKTHRKSLEQFISHLESNVHTIKPNTLKLLQHISKDTKE